MFPFVCQCSCRVIVCWRDRLACSSCALPCLPTLPPRVIINPSTHGLSHWYFEYLKARCRSTSAPVGDSRDVGKIAWKAACHALPCTLAVRRNCFEGASITGRREVSD